MQGPPPPLHPGPPRTGAAQPGWSDSNIWPPASSHGFPALGSFPPAAAFPQAAPTPAGGYPVPNPGDYSRPPPGFPAPPPAPQIGQLAPGPGSRDPRLRRQSQEEAGAGQQVDTAVLRAAVNAVLGSGKKTVGGSSPGRLGIRRDIYAEPGRGSGPVAASPSPWSQPLPTPQLNSQSAATASMELQAAVKQEVVELEDELNAEEKAEEKESKEKGSGGAGELVRCGFCPSPGLVPVTEKIKHQAGHLAATFSCAACSGRRRFQLFAEVVKHVHTLHEVTDGLMVLETIILPSKLT